MACVSILWHSANASPPNLVFENCSPKEKKSFNLKSRENSHEVMVDNCYKALVALQAAAREVMIFLFFGDQHHFGLHYTISGDGCPKKW